MTIDWPRFERNCRRLLPARGVVAARQELLAYDSDGLTLHCHAPEAGGAAGDHRAGGRRGAALP